MSLWASFFISYLVRHLTKLIFLFGDKGIFWLNFVFLSWNHLNGGRGGLRENQHYFCVKKQIYYHLNGGRGSLREKKHFFCVIKQFLHFLSTNLTKGKSVLKLVFQVFF